MKNSQDRWDIVLDESFVAAASHHEPSAEERAERSRGERRSARIAARRQRRAQRRQRLVARGKVAAILALLGAAGLWMRPPGSSRAAAAPAVAPQTIHVLYAVPADATLDPGMVPAIQQEIEVAQGWFASQTGGHRLRMTPAQGAITVDVRHLKVTQRALADRADAFGLVRDELQPASPSAAGAPQEIDLAFVPVTFASQVRCGEGATGDLAIVWMGSCGLSPSAATETFGEGETFVIAHELAHTLGAVAPCAPHYGNDGHVIDDPRDLLYDGPIQVPRSSALLDPGHDDYYRTGRHDCPDIANSPVWTT